MTPPPDPLDPLLDHWGQAPSQPPLAAEVRRRLSALEAGRAAEPESTWWRHLDIAFGRASFAAAFVTACLLLGLFLAELRVSRLQADRDRQLAESYLRLIDPLLLAASRPASHPGS